MNKTSISASISVKDADIANSSDAGDPLRAKYVAERYLETQSVLILYVICLVLLAYTKEKDFCHGQRHGFHPWGYMPQSFILNLMWRL